MFDRMMKSFAFASVFALASSAAACGGTPFTEEQEANASEEDPTSGFSAQGLQIDSKAKDRVSGSFTSSGTALRFELVRDGAKRIIRIERESGDQLIESTLEDGIDTMIVLGGRAKIVGPVNEEPMTREGDQAIFEELQKLPEAALIPMLKEALLAQKIDRDFLYPAQTAAGGIQPKMYFDGYWNHLSYNEGYGFWSWSFWGTTTVVLAGEYANYFKATFALVGNPNVEWVSGYSMTTYRRQWGGAYVVVTNKYLGLCQASYPYRCPRLLSHNY